MKQKTDRVFISGTYTDLTSERKAAEEILTRLEMLPVTMPFAAAPGDGITIKRDESLRQLEKADAMILIFGRRYGEPDLPGDPRSITEVEFDWAQEHQIPCYVFMQDSWSTAETNPKLIEQHKAFKAKIDREKVWAVFKNCDDLKSQIQLTFHKNPISDRVAGKPFHRWQEFFQEQLADDVPPHITLKQPLLCRSGELGQLRKFIVDSNSRVCAMSGGQGLGKSRLLLEFARGVESEVPVLFLNELAFNSDHFDKDTVDSLPKTQGAAVVFDDAHNVQNLLTAVVQVLESRPLAKVILAGRPTPEYEDAVRLLGENHKLYSLSQFALPTLPGGAELSSFIARELPSDPAPDRLAKDLHRGSGGVPWILHFAVLFFRERRMLPAGLISRDAAFREFVLRKILGTRHDTLQAGILQWLALITPCPRDSKEWRDVFKKLLNTDDNSIGAAIDLWCQERMLRLKGRSLRFVSEIVRDFFVLQLAHTPELKDKIIGSFFNPLLKNVLKNLSLGAALDRFDASGQPAKVAPVFDGIWEPFRECLFKESPASQQEISTASKVGWI